MNRMAQVLACGAALAIAVAGCEFEGVTDTVTNRGFDWVNLNGLYRNPGGGAMVVGYTVTPGEASSTNTVTGEILTYGVAGYHTYSGNLGNKEIAKGTLAISAGGFVFNDNSDGTLTGTGGTSGTIDYSTGAWSIDLGALEIPAATTIIASYQHTVGGSAGKVTPGSTKTTIYSMLVSQSGDCISLMDSDGYTYTGRLFSVSSTTGEGQSQTAGLVVAPFRVTGVSKGKVNVTIEGTFTAIYLATEAQTGGGGGGTIGQQMGRPTMYVLSDRRIDGTWIETNSSGKILKSGNVVGATTDFDEETLNITVELQV